ncbi:choice-of-anchor D domain-containing protein [Curtobacterium sp. MCPF17_002]|uniref:choice-of-anchor D domain-containing protein n=1 Tax=Curtobacterium sp. MCPF17_002 TaxID=2175645 RepID=UPI000DA7430A|nr:choice-of-anchor D domain-containing protein [Curtobacterium sp. MCPF17_002]WIB79213.1 choice-of-anchor D domain-containing protein [Curtobacterium sp. MCPF17_002]
MQRFTRAAAMTAATFLTASALGFTGLEAASAATPTPTGGVLQILSPLYSERGLPQFADGANVQRYIADTTRGIDARMTVSSTSSATFTLTPPDGKPLTTGTYRLVGTQAYGAKVPTLQLNGEYIYGDFHILDLASDPTNGVITRFDAVVPGIGEFRFGEDASGSVVLGSRNIVFAKTFIGLPKTMQVETLHNTGTAAVALGAPSVAGVNATSFSVSNSTCKATLAAGATCTFNVGFAPKTAGPVSAALNMKVGTATKTIPLAGSAYLGTTGITSSGKDIVDKGVTTKVSSANTAMTVGSGAGGWTFNADNLDGSGSVLRVFVEGPGDGAIPVGTRKTYISGQGNGYSLLTTVRSSGCDTTGTETVKQFTLDPATGLPDTVDLSFTQYCIDKNAQTGTLQWQARADLTAPAAPTAVTVSATSPRKVTWKASTSKDAQSVVARLVQGTGAGATPQSGTPLIVSGTSATVPAVPSGQQYTVALFAVDATGNVSKPAAARFGTPPVTVTAPGRPTITSTTSGTGSVTVSFTAPANDGGLPITSYVLSTLYGSRQVTGPSSPLTLTGLPAGNNMVRVIPVNAAGQGQVSYAVTVTVS